MLIEPPDYFRVVIGFPSHVVISPLVIFGLPLRPRLTLVIDTIIVVVCKLESMIVVPSLLLHAEETGL